MLPASARQRLLRGQFYTPALLCDLMLALAASAAKTPGRVLEPGCGEGAFLQRAYARMRQAEGLSAAEALGRLQGMEIDPLARERALAHFAELAGDAPLPGDLILPGDFLSPAAEALAPADLIIGNPPYVRQEHWAQAHGPAKTKALAYLRARHADYLAACPDQSVLFGKGVDVYVAFFLQAASLLCPGGRLAFVTSNSWMNLAYGTAFRRFLHEHFRLRFVLESVCERWFSEAAINAAIVVLDRVETQQEKNYPVHLVRLHEPLSDWLPDPADAGYWQALHHLADRLGCSDAPEPPGCTIRPIPQARFLVPEQPASPAFYLRAPLEWSSLLQEQETWQPLSAWGQVRYPIKTGINRFFYLSAAQAATWRIEPEFLYPVVKSARAVRRYALNDADCETWLFTCPHTRAELSALGKTGALEYIAWGERQTSAPRQKRARPVPWPEVPSVRNHRPAWYALQPPPPADILCSRFLDQRFFFARCTGRLAEDQTFYGLTLAEGGPNPDLAAGLLNATLTFLLLEYHARTNLGKGVLQYGRFDMAALPVPRPDCYSPSEQAEIAACFARMAGRAILPVAEEVGQADRLALDMAVLAPLAERLRPGTDVTALRERLVNQLIGRMAERARMARSVRPR